MWPIQGVQRTVLPLTFAVTPRSLRSLARQAVKGAAWEGRGNAFAALRSALALREPTTVNAI